MAYPRPAPFPVLVILQFFPRFSNVSPALSALPLIVVLAITALKDGYEDLKRHQSDRFINNLGAHVLAGPTVHNPNLTITKSRGISMRWLGDLFPWVGSIPIIGTSRAAKRAAKESERAAQDLAVDGNGNGEYDENGLTEEEMLERQSLAGGKRHWWGSRKRAVSKSAPAKPKSGGKKFGGLLSSGPDPGAAAGHNQAAMQSVLFDEVDENGVTRTTSRMSRLQSQRNVGQQAGADGTHDHHHSQVLDEPLEDGLEKDKSVINRAHWKKTVWEDVKVGDFVRLRDNDSIPAGKHPLVSASEEASSGAISL